MLKTTIIPTFFLIVIAAASGGIFIFAASVVRVAYQRDDSLVGSYINVTNTLLAIDKGVSRASQTLTASGTSASPTLFSTSSGEATTGIAIGDWIITFSVNTTATTSANVTYTVTLFFESGSHSLVFTVYLMTPLTLPTTVSDEILCQFDLGSSLANSYSYTLVIH